MAIGFLFSSSDGRLHSYFYTLQPGRPLPAKTMHPLGGGFRSDAEAGSGQLQRHSSGYILNQILSTAQGKSGILVDVHSVFPRKLDCSSQSASLVPIEWTTS